MAAARKKSGLPLTLLATTLVAVPLLIAPPVIRGLAASAWVSHYADLPALPRPHRTAAREVVERTEVAALNLAPLPQASATVIRALELGQRIEREEGDHETALVIYRGVRGVCARVRARPMSGAGFAVIEARAAALEEAAVAAAEARGTQ
jgi:hypothetical protein